MGAAPTFPQRPVAPVIRAALCAALLQASTPAACALDVGVIQPPAVVEDGHITIGERTLWLPKGDWYLVDTAHTPVSGGPRNLVTETLETAYLVEVERGVFALGVRVSMLRADLSVRDWKTLPCSGADTLRANEHGASRWRPDCTSIDGERGAAFDKLVRSNSPRAAQWLQERQIPAPGMSVGIRYARGTDDSFGSIVLIVPAAHFDSDASAAAWTESLRTALKPLFEHRVSEGRIPPLPAAPPPDDVASRPAERASQP